jgi:SAM-dependent MidA family methyltransferase
MRRALYDPGRGYYRNGRDLFGKNGDFFTASQLQPLFGRIIAAEARALCPDRPFYELGPGRREMAEYAGSPYIGIDIDDDLPAELNGFVFANEFFDALPVRVGTRHNGILYELLVEDGEFVRGPQLDSAGAVYVGRYWPFIEEGGRFEIGIDTLTWIDCISARMQRGYALFIDYGCTTAETIRFPHGTLMSYRNHTATEAILRNPGRQDITAHVAFDALRDRAVEDGFEFVRLETLARLVLRVVERQPSLVEGDLAQKQLRTLLFGMGEAFRCLWLKKTEGK